MNNLEWDAPIHREMGPATKEPAVIHCANCVHLRKVNADLLAACIAVVDIDGFVGSGIMRKRIKEMKDAIAKATGA